MTTIGTERERGFALLELVASMAIFAAAAAATLGAVAAVARGAAPGAVRDGALMVAQNALVRARAAAAYVPATAADPVTAASSAAFALVAGTRRFTAGVRLVGSAPCGGRPVTLRLPVTTTFDGTATVTVTVAYPQDPCASRGTQRSVTLTETLPPPAYAPGTPVVREIAPPATM